ncbi:amidohydrolase family protein [Phenylobacterium sp.]|jgi:predicted TIM-barrel fold metal-dependent hydrolase|uniref:amidohydrolase family protein n=1 Tax=Phenylobacterium sp. TaxID=1871053 RepID=UPI002F42B00F
MPYATGRVFHDADSHVMEPADWLAAHADEALKARLGQRQTAERIEQGVATARARKGDAEASRTAAENLISGPKGWVAYGAFDAEERTRALDELGFSRQLVFATSSLGPFRTSSNPDVLYGGARAHNRAMAAFCADERLIGVAFVPLDDPKRALEEAEEAIRLGCGAIWVPSTPAGERSPGHPDLDPFWQLLADKRIPFMLHIGPGSRVLPAEYTNNGKPRSPDLHGGGENLRFKDFVVLPFSAQMFLAALIYDGLFDRVPDLRGGVIEFGAAWVPGFLRQLDLGYRSFGKTDPLIKAFSMKPSDYIRKHIKFTPFPGEDAGYLIRDAGADLFLFSSDYPHPEGTNDPIGRFERTFEGLSEDDRERFYSKNFEEMMGAF